MKTTSNTKLLIRVLHLKVKHAQTDHWLKKNLTLGNSLQVFNQVHSLMSAVFGENVEDSSSDSNAHTSTRCSGDHELGLVVSNPMRSLVVRAMIFLDTFI